MSTTSGILEQVKEGIEPVCQKYNWELSTATDPFAVFDTLYQSTGKGVVIVAYGGKQLHQQVARSVVSKTRFTVSVSTRRDLTNPMGGIISAQSGDISLMDMLDLIEAEILAMDFENGLSECNAHFESCQPLTTPDGIPLDCFQFSYWVYNASQGRVYESSSESSSSSISSSYSSESSSNYGCLEVVGGYAGVEGLYYSVGTDTVNGIEFNRWAKGNYEIIAEWSEGNFKWHIRNAGAVMYWVSTGQTPALSPVGLVFNVNTPFYPAPTIADP